MNYIELAKQAGWEYAHNDSGFEPLWAFAKLVDAAARAEEREECAKLCDERTDDIYASRDTVDCAEWLASEIRARGTT